MKIARLITSMTSLDSNLFEHCDFGTWEPNTIAIADVNASICSSTVSSLVISALFSAASCNAAVLVSISPMPVYWVYQMHLNWKMSPQSTVIRLMEYQISITEGCLRRLRWITEPVRIFEQPKLDMSQNCRKSDFPANWRASEAINSN